MIKFVDRNGQDAPAIALTAKDRKLINYMRRTDCWYLSTVDTDYSLLPPNCFKGESKIADNLYRLTIYRDHERPEQKSFVTFVKTFQKNVDKGKTIH